MYKTEGDTMLFVVGSADENEILLFNAVLALRDCLNILLKASVDRRTIIENYVGFQWYDLDFGDLISNRIWSL